MECGAVCAGCLSGGRRLRLLAGGDARYLTRIARAVGGGGGGSAGAVCWECAARVRGARGVRRRLRAAQRTLVEAGAAVERGVTPSYTSLSRLALTPVTSHSVTSEDATSGSVTIGDATSRCVTFSHVTSEDATSESVTLGDSTSRCVTFSHTTSEHVTSRDATSESVTIGDSTSRCVTFSHVTSKHVTSRDATSLPELQFVKVEADDEHIDNDHYTEAKAEIKSDPSVKPAKERKRRKTRETAEFDSSDDEPLTTKVKKKRAPRGERPPGEVRGAAKVRAEKTLHALGVKPGAVTLVLLSWDEVESERLRRLSSFAVSSQPHRCDHCAVGYSHTDKMAAHMDKHAPIPGGSECDACHIWCRDSRALQAHRRRHRLRWRCTICGATRSRAAVAADHVAATHGDSPATHRCTSCDHTATSLGKLRVHTRRCHGGGDVRCEQCGKMLADTASLRTHRFIHRGKKEHVCGECGKRFLMKRALQVHSETHRESAALYCHQCDVSFKSRMSHYQHVRYSSAHAPATARAHHCARCPRSFTRAAALREHAAAVHDGSTPVRCGQDGCEFACASRSVLRAHVRRVHVRGVHVHGGQRASSGHVCHLCGNMYTSRKTLEGHLLAHSGSRPLRCSHCPATFAHRAALYNHTRGVHLKIKTGRGRSAATNETCTTVAAVEPPATATTEVTTAATTEATARWLPVLTHIKTDDP